LKLQLTLSPKVRCFCRNIQVNFTNNNLDSSSKGKWKRKKSVLKFDRKERKLTVVGDSFNVIPVTTPNKARPSSREIPSWKVTNSPQTEQKQPKKATYFGKWY